MNQKHRIVVADDNEDFRSSVCALLEDETGVEVVGEADNGPDAIQSASALTPDLMIVDLSMLRGGAVKAIAQIKLSCPNVRVLLISGHAVTEYADGLLKAGADGYLVKGSVGADLTVAVHSLLQGKKFASRELGLGKAHGIV